MFIYYDLIFMSQATFLFCKVFCSLSMDRIDHILSQRALTVLIILGSGILFRQFP